MRTIVCFKWRSDTYSERYSAAHVNALHAMLYLNVTQPFRLVCITDDAEGIQEGVQVVPLWENPAPQYGGPRKPNCFYRLRLFDRGAREFVGDRFLWLDLDCVILRNIDHLLDCDADLRIWKPDGGDMRCNGSLLFHKTGTRDKIWSRFNRRLVHPVHGLKHTLRYSGSDQAWIAHQLRGSDTFFTGYGDGVYSYRMHVEGRDTPPDNACIVFFNGLQKPWSADVRNLPWVRDNYFLSEDAA